MSSASYFVELLPTLDTVARLPFRRYRFEDEARRLRDDKPSRSSGLFSRNSVEVAKRIELEEWAESVGEGGGWIEDVSEACEVGEPNASREFRADSKFGGGRERNPRSSVGDVP